jgi:putative ABC transport system permease protein
MQIGDILRAPFRYLIEMRRDFRYALRALIKSPGFALVGIISTGIAMGLTTIVYNSKWQLISGNLPSAANAKSVVMLEKPVSYYYIEKFRDQKSLFSGVAALQTAVPFNVSFQAGANAKAERIFGQLVSANYFSVLGVQPQRGRVFNAELDKPGDAPVVVVSDRFWRNRLNSDPDAVGRTIWLNRQLATIVGITPKGFNGALSLNPSELFVPITAPSTLAPELANDVLHQRSAKEFLALMCLTPGSTVESAEAALDTITHQLDDQDTSAVVRTDKGRRVSLLSAGTMVPIPRKLKPVIMGFYVVLMGLIMLIACMNLANMLLARGANRRKELAIRLSIGASRYRLVRQMVSEGILLSVLGGIAGFVLAYLISILNSQFLPPSAIPIEPTSAPDWHVAVFVLALAIVCGVGFSVMPALRATKVDMTPALKEGSALQLPGYRRFGLRNLLMVTQVSGSLMLLLITGFLVVGISHVSNVPTKFNPHKLYLLSVDPVRDGYTPEKAEAFFERVHDRLKTIPMVNNIVMAAQPPFSIQEGTVQVTSEDSRGDAKAQILAVEETVGAGYFAALSEPMLSGREFTDQDQRNTGNASTALPVVLNQSAARGFFGNQNPIGGRIKDDKKSYEVVGLVHDLKNGLAESQSVIYLPLTQRDFVKPPAGGITIMVRSDAGSDALGAIRQQISFLDPNLNVFNVRTLSDYLEMSRSYQRFALNTYGGIGVFGLILSAIGLAGLTAYAVAQRRKEIGIRMALGATRGQVLLLVLREGAALVIVGTVLGFVGAFGLAKMLSSLTSVFVDALKIGTNDPRLIFGAPLLLALLALLACYVPARRAAKIDPIKALRQG